MFKRRVNTQAQGQTGEDLALAYLKARGLNLIERNYRSRMGEIDLIMQDREALVFVEVRARENTRDIHPFETITPQKQRRILQTAQLYLQTHNKSDSIDCRFDVIGVSLHNQHIDWVKDAFV